MHLHCELGQVADMSTIGETNKAAVEVRCY